MVFPMPHGVKRHCCLCWYGAIRWGCPYVRVSALYSPDTTTQTHSRAHWKQETRRKRIQVPPELSCQKAETHTPQHMQKNAQSSPANLPSHNHNNTSYSPSFGNVDNKCLSHAEQLLL
mmetsp:Transcript_105035/g.177414  ORF Transcript_105035/g.177414 Transcript_105035/m.177414 type:complete len:118 (-) Transcript_105035:130-483(-)